MNIFDKLFGHRQEHEENPEQRHASRSFTGPAPEASGPLSDEQAIERYRYMLRTAPPETIEQAHAEAFARLTPEQRRIVLEQLSAEVPEQERLRPEAAEDPQALARMATRAELREPGVMERVFGGVGAYGGGGFGMSSGPGLGSVIAGSFLGGIAANIVGSMIARQFFTTAGPGQAFLGGSEYDRPLFAPSGSVDDSGISADDAVDSASEESSDDNELTADSEDMEGSDYEEEAGDDGGFDSGGGDDFA